ncbi:Hypp8835 [Branchiostoma lanceolatum]|uniref:Hypp8835 protein n=1 Tax=Branchiostoma lanceolatum TaxID=7740 RepID=A0A8J9Z9C1_BRALA|nr:Hypp8835 [Branchiostoma lanceolatum]
MADTEAVSMEPFAPVSTATGPSEVVGKTKEEDSRTYLVVAVAILDHAILGLPVILQKLKGHRNDFRVDVNLPTVKQACSLSFHKIRTYQMEQVMTGDIDVRTVDSFEDDEVRHKVKSAIEERMRCMVFGRQPARTRAKQLKKFPMKDGRMAIILSCPIFNQQQGRVLAVIDGEDPPWPVMIRKSDLDLDWREGEGVPSNLGGRKRGEKLNDDEFTKMVDLLERVLQGLPGSDLQPFPVSEDGKTSIRDKLLPVKEDGETDDDQSSLDYIEATPNDGPLSLQRGPVKSMAATFTDERQHIVCHDTDDIGGGMAMPGATVEQEEHCPVFPWCDPSEMASMLPLFFKPYLDPWTIPGELKCIVVHIFRECVDKHNCPVKKALIKGYASYVSPGSCTSYRKCWTFYCSGCKTSDVRESSTFLFRAIMENFLNRVRKTNGFFFQPLSELVAELESLTDHQAYVLLTVVRFTDFQYQETLDTVRDVGHDVTIASVIKRLRAVRGLPIWA